MNLVERRLLYEIHDLVQLQMCSIACKQVWNFLAAKNLLWKIAALSIKWIRQHNSFSLLAKHKTKEKVKFRRLNNRALLWFISSPWISANAFSSENTCRYFCPCVPSHFFAWCPVSTHLRANTRRTAGYYRRNVVIFKSHFFGEKKYLTSLSK